MSYKAQILQTSTLFSFIDYVQNKGYKIVTNIGFLMNDNSFSAS